MQLLGLIWYHSLCLKVSLGVLLDVYILQLMWFFFETMSDTIISNSKIFSTPTNPLCTFHGFKLSYI